nr:PREDICTED: zona pellucida sperm-binding protein 2-like isoform X1 [Lepisosteus oculatus]
MRCIQVVWLMMTVFRRMGLGVKPGPSAVPAEAGHSRCTEEYMEVSVSQKLPLDQVANSSQWSLEVHDGRRTRTLTLSQARAQGYELSTGKRQTVIRAYYSAKGLRIFSRPQKKKSLYLADLLLRCDLGYTKLQMPILFLCVPEPVTCRETDIRIEVPAFNGTFLSMAVEDRTYLATRKHLDVQVQRLWDTLRLTVPASSPLVRRRDCVDATRRGQQVFLPAVQLSFAVREEEATMMVEPVCPCKRKEPCPAGLLCTDGHRVQEVSANGSDLALDLPAAAAAPPGDHLRDNATVGSSGDSIQMVKVQLFFWTLPLELVLVGTICMVHLLLHLWVGR